MTELLTQTDSVNMSSWYNQPALTMSTDRDSNITTIKNDNFYIELTLSKQHVLFSSVNKNALAIFNHQDKILTVVYQKHGKIIILNKHIPYTVDFIEFITSRIYIYNNEKLCKVIKL